MWDVEDLEAEYGFPIDFLAPEIAAVTYAHLANEKLVARDLLSDGEVDILNKCWSENVKEINEDLTFSRLDKLEFKLRRASLELTHSDSSVWTDLVKLELEEWKDKWGQRVNMLKGASFLPTLHSLESVKTKLLAASEKSSALETATDVLQSFYQLGSYPFFSHIMPISRSLVARVGSNLSDIPKSRLFTLCHVDWLHITSTLKWFCGQEHATAVLLNRPYRLTRRDGMKPLWTFLTVDPTFQYWEDFAEGLSRSVSYGQAADLLRFNFSTNEALPGSDEKQQLEQLFKKVQSKPYSVVVLEKVDHACDSTVDFLYGILQTGCLSDGTVVDLSQAVVIMVTGSSCPSTTNPNCQALSKTSFKSLMDICSDISNPCEHECSCVSTIAEVKQRISPTLWKLLDDVMVFSQLADCQLKATARRLLRDIAQRFMVSRTIICPTEAALDAIIGLLDLPKGVLSLKQWLAENIVPVLQGMLEEGKIEENSVVFIDVHAGTAELSYKVESISCLPVHDDAKDLLQFVADWRTICLRGKDLEFNIVLSRMALNGLCGEVNEIKPGASFLLWVMQELIKYVDNAITAAGDIVSLKEKLGFCIEETVSRKRGHKRKKRGSEGIHNVVGDHQLKPKIKRKKSVSEGIHNVVGDHQSKPEIVELIRQVLLKKLDSSDHETKEVPATYLLIGLRSDGKLKLLDELRSNLVDDKAELVYLDLGHCTENDSLPFSLVPCSQSSSGDRQEWLRVIETVKKHPYSILFFDQVEKAHNSWLNMLTPVLASGAVVGEGDTVDFRRTVVILASDADSMEDMAALVGCSTDDSLSLSKDKEKRPIIRSELLEEVDEAVVFIFDADNQLKTPLIRLSNTDRSLKEKRMSNQRSGSLLKEFTNLFASNVRWV